MTWLCALRLASILIAVAVLVTVTAVVSYGLGWKTANRAYWDMMHRAGSKITKGW